MTSPAETKPNRSLFDIFKSVISSCYFIVFFIILLCLILFSWISYCTNKDIAPFQNFLSLIIGIVFCITIYFLFRKVSFSDKKFRIIATVTFIILFIAQIIILQHSYFYTDWDVKLVHSITNDLATNGSLSNAGSHPYLTMYPNNVFLVAILTFFKSIPFFGSHYLFLLAINAALVNLAGVFTCLTIKKLVSNKAAILSIFIITPLILLNPWMIIPYSDTFTILIPILVFYIYIQSKNQWWRYPTITFLALIGYFIKPTSIIILVAIFLVELFRHNWLKKTTYSKQFFKHLALLCTGGVLAFCCRTLSFHYIHYQRVENMSSISFIHYLAMGQNDEVCGMYSETDVQEAANGKLFELKKFFSRIIARNPAGQANFIAKKLLTNFNDGTFAWAQEGTYFYDVIPERTDALSTFLKSFYYAGGPYYQIFVSIAQFVWVITLFGCLFLAKRHSHRNITVLQLALIEITAFVMLFEARARYLYCYAPLFVTGAILGFYNLKNRLITKYTAKNSTLLKAKNLH